MVSSTPIKWNSTTAQGMKGDEGWIHSKHCVLFTTLSPTNTDNIIPPQILTYEIESENTNRTGHLLYWFSSLLLLLVKVQRHLILYLGNQRLPESLRASHRQKGFPQGRGQAETTEVYNWPSKADSPTDMESLAGGVLQPVSCRKFSRTPLVLSTAGFYFSF